MPKGTCAVEGCGKPIAHLTWCGRHYHRQRNYGDPTISRHASPGVPLAWLRDAMLIETDDCIDWPFSKGRLGYGTVWFEQQTRKVHHVVFLLAGLPVPRKPLVTRHLCGRPPCVNLRHLATGTQKENSADRLLHGTTVVGDRHPNSKLRAADVLAIRASTERHYLLAIRFGVSDSTIIDVRARRSWAHLS